MKCVDPMLELLSLDLYKISENGRNIYEWNQNKQTILEINFDWTSSNERRYQSPGRLTFWRFGISKYDQYSEILSNVTERGYSKQYLSELIDVRFGRSTFNHFKSFHYYFALSTNTYQQLLHLVPLHRV